MCCIFKSLSSENILDNICADEKKAGEEEKKRKQEGS